LPFLIRGRQRENTDGSSPDDLWRGGFEKKPHGEKRYSFRKAKALCSDQYRPVPLNCTNPT